MGDGNEKTSGDDDDDDDDNNFVVMDRRATKQRGRNGDGVRGTKSGKICMRILRQREREVAEASKVNARNPVTMSIQVTRIYIYVCVYICV